MKFQVYRPETVYVENAGQSDYLAEAGIKQDIRTIFADLAMPYEMIGDLASYCRDKGIDFLSTGFSPEDFAAIDPFVAIQVEHPQERPVGPAETAGADNRRICRRLGSVRTPSSLSAGARSDLADWRSKPLPGCGIHPVERAGRRWQLECRQPHRRA